MGMDICRSLSPRRTTRKFTRKIFLVSRTKLRLIILKKLETTTGNMFALNAENHTSPQPL
ncbi:GSCOCG00002786001-RA-CDS [Cotesia congregata]|nr:GSCOCG00002786001-RA-CDS [Cotesia congregata]